MITGDETQQLIPDNIVTPLDEFLWASTTMQAAGWRRHPALDFVRRGRLRTHSEFQVKFFQILLLVHFSELSPAIRLGADRTISILRNV